MSVQPATQLPEPAAQSVSTVNRMRSVVSRWRTEPNPIWKRELQQAIRLNRTPAILATITVLVVILMTAVGSISIAATTSSSTGIILHHTFFSIAFFVVCLVAPALGANGVASEREGRTWEAVLLTGLSPRTIAWGKFFSAFSNISMYIMMMAPVGALPFLFGGVTALEVVIAFIYLFVFAALGTAMGLAISSAMSSGRVAILITLLLAFVITLHAFGGMGFGMSYAASTLWPGVVQGGPVWLPSAYERARFSVWNVAVLGILPIAALVVSLWFFFALTIANIASCSDDRTTGLKRWFMVTTPVVAVGLAAYAYSAHATASMAVAVPLFVLLLYLTFTVFVFIGDVVGPSRRVLVRWERAGTGRIARFLGPGIINTVSLQMVLGVVSSILVSLVGSIGLFWNYPGGVSRVLGGKVLCATIHLTSYYVFVLGTAAWFRTRVSTHNRARLLLIVVVFGTSVLPWPVAATVAAIAQTSLSTVIALAAPSPVFVVTIAERASPHPSGSFDSVFVASSLCSLFWIVLGLGLFASAYRRAKTLVGHLNASIAAMDNQLASECAAGAESSVPGGVLPASVSADNAVSDFGAIADGASVS